MPSVFAGTLASTFTSALTSALTAGTFVLVFFPPEVDRPVFFFVLEGLV